MGYEMGYELEISIVLILLALIISVGLAFIPAYFAKKKGYSYMGFWLFGFFLFVPALIVVLIISDKTQVIIDSAGEIAKYKTLLDEGTISPEEFEKKKSELLEK